jgi:hypothetical protein
MKYSEFRKTQTHHSRCVVCGQPFNATYDETLRAFPVFHPAVNPRKMKGSCESKFYESLLLLYAYINRVKTSLTSSHIMNEYDWRGKILMKKETLCWWLSRGYFNVDDFQRITIPPPVEDIACEIFATQNLSSQEELQRAIEMLKAVFQCTAKDLKPVSSGKMPFKTELPNQGDSTLFDNIDTTQVSLRREKKGMVTAERTGAKEIDKRMSAPSVSMERRRIEKIR